MANYGRIAIVSDQSLTSGIGVYAAELFNLLREEVPGLTFYSLNYLPELSESKGVRPAGWRPAKSLLTVPLARRRNEEALRRVLETEFSGVHMCGTSYALARESIRSLATVHDYYFRKPNSTILRSPRIAVTEAYNAFEHVTQAKYLAMCNGIVSVSQSTQEDLLRSSGLNSTVVHTWVDPTRFKQRSRADAREVLSLPHDVHIILNVSSSSLNKDLPTLEAVARTLPSNYLLVKIGARLPTLSGKVKNFNRVAASSYPLFFNAADVYLQTSIKEGFGIPLIEAMASGLPVVAADSSAALEVLGGAGVLIRNPHAPSDYVRALRGLEGSSKLEDLTAAGLRRAGLFAPERARTEYLQVYKAVFG